MSRPHIISWSVGRVDKTVDNPLIIISHWMWLVQVNDDCQALSSSWIMYSGPGDTVTLLSPYTWHSCVWSGLEQVAPVNNSCIGEINGKIVKMVSLSSHYDKTSTTERQDWVRGADTGYLLQTNTSDHSHINTVTQHSFYTKEAKVHLKVIFWINFYSL